MNRPASPPAALPDFPFATPERPALVRGAFLCKICCCRGLCGTKAAGAIPEGGRMRSKPPVCTSLPGYGNLLSRRFVRAGRFPLIRRLSATASPQGGSQPYRTPSPGRGRCPRRGRMRSKLPSCARPAGLWKPAFTEVCAGRPKKTAKYTLPRTLHAIMTLSNFTTQGGFL